MRTLTTTREFGVVLVPGGMASVWPHQTQTQRYSLENAQLWAPACPSATPAGLSPLAARDWHFGCRASPPCRCLLSDEGHVVIPSSSKEHLLCCQEFPETPSPSSSSSLPSRAAGCLPQGKGDTDFGVTPACSRGPSAVGCACGGKERQCRPGGTFRACNIQHGGHTGQECPAGRHSFSSLRLHGNSGTVIV